MMPLHQQPRGGTTAGLLGRESVQQLHQPRSQRFLLVPLRLGQLKLGQSTIVAIERGRVAALVRLLLELADLLPLLQVATLERVLCHRDPGIGRAVVEVSFARLYGGRAQEGEQHDRLKDAVHEIER
jgi:DNA-binding XRE family transcriptional regulator